MLVEEVIVVVGVDVQGSMRIEGGVNVNRVGGGISIASIKK